MTTDTLPTTDPSGCAQIIPDERRQRVLAHYREVLTRIEKAGICLETLRMDMAAIFPATLARMDHAASIAEHAANWHLRMNDGWQAFADALAVWEAAVLDADATVSEVHTRREMTRVPVEVAP